MNSLVIDEEFKQLIPPLTEEELKQLEKNILSEGCRDALVVWKGTLIDGHNRYRICQEHRLTYKIVEKDFASRGDVLQWIILNQFGRRNLTNYQRSELALKLKPVIQAKARERQVQSGKQFGKGTQKSAEPIPRSETRDELAKLAGVSHDTIKKAEAIQNKGTPEQIERARKGGEGNSVNAVYKEVVKEPAKPKVTKELLDKIAKSICNPDRQVKLGFDDTFVEMKGLVDTFNWQIGNWLDDYKELIQTTSEKEKIIAVLSEAETAIGKIKGVLQYE